MKRFLFFVSLVLLTLPAVASAQRIDLEVKGIDVGASYQTVLRQLGKPLSRKNGGIVPCSDGSILLTLRYQGLKIELYSDDEGKSFYVFTMEVTSPKWSLSGLNIGATLKDVQAKFVQTRKPTKESGLENLSYFITDGYANFWFRNNKLVKVDWELNLC